MDPYSPSPANFKFTKSRIKLNSPNVHTPSSSDITDKLAENQQPLGTQFKSYELSAASNYWTLDPFQYNITKFKYNLPIVPLDNTSSSDVVIHKSDFKNDPGLVYRDVNFEKLLPAYTSTKKSVNDFPAQSYHRFLANEGYFNPNESTNNTDLWYYGADKPIPTGAALNVQEVQHIIFPESQRGGTNSQNLAKYSWVSKLPKRDTTSWESINYTPVDNSQNCEFFNYNNGYTTSTDSFKIQNDSFNKVYSFDSNYVRGIGISPPDEGSMPNPNFY